MSVSAPAGLYVHVPFCISKCPYCDFYSVPAPDRIPGTLEDLALEAQLVAKSLGPFDSLYVGGGTPSCLAPDQLSDLLSISLTLATLAGVAGELEFSVELNPADVTDELLDRLHQAGVNRISLGVQSFDDKALRQLGRRHDAAGARAAIERIRTADFASLGLDLIYGRPEQRPAELRADLNHALATSPEHLSCYALTLSPTTPMGARAAAGELGMPDEDLSVELFLLVADTLGAAGYEHYEVSNFARDRTLRSRHNQKYWNRTPTLGLGPAAHSFDGRNRWWNHRDLDEYHEALAAGLRPVADFEQLDDDRVRLERLGLGLRTCDGVARAVAAPRPEHEPILERLVAEGLLEERKDRLVPTLRGMLVADALAGLLA